MATAAAAAAPAFDWCGEKNLLSIHEVYPQEACSPDQGKTLAHPDHLDPEDLAQGHHPDCFFVAAVGSLLSANPKFIADLFITNSVQESGKYKMRFFRHGNWEIVEIDDKIAVDARDRSPSFVRSPKGYWWPCLLEKAYATFYAGYGAIAGGNLSEALHDLTGLPVFSYQLQAKSSTTPLGKKFWESLSNQFDGDKIAASAGTSAKPPHDLGLQPGHAYSVMDVFPEHNLIVLMNPNKLKHYTGPMHAQDPKWTPKLREELGIFVTEGKDARSKIRRRRPKRADLFAMPIDLFLQHFGSLQVCQLHLASAPSPRIARGQWDEATSGGCTNYCSWRTNTLYPIVNESSTAETVYIVLQHDPDQRIGSAATKNISYFEAGTTIIKRKRELRNTPYLSANATNAAATHDVLFKPIYYNNRDITCSISVPAGEEVVAVPSTYAPFVLESYTMLLYSASGSSKFTEPTGQDFSKHLSPEGKITFRMGKGDTRSTAVTLKEGCTGVHLLVKQPAKNPPPKTPNPKQPPQPDTVANHFLSITIKGTNGGVIQQLPAATNYTEFCFHVPITQGAEKDEKLFIDVRDVNGSGAITVDVRARMEHPEGATVLSEAPAMESSSAQVGEAPPTATAAPPGKKSVAVAPGKTAPKKLGHGPSSKAPGPAPPTSKKAPAAKKTVAPGGKKSAPMSMQSAGKAPGNIANLYAGLE